MVGVIVILNSGIIGELVELNLVYINEFCISCLLYKFIEWFVMVKWKKFGEVFRMDFFMLFKCIVGQWFKGYIDF